MRLLLSHFYTPGSLLTIQLSDEAKGEKRTFSVQVVHIAPEGKRHWIMGCAFVYPLRKDDLRVLMADDTISVPSQEAKHRSECRTWVRHPAGQAVSCRPIGASTAETAWLGNLGDISLGGLGLHLTRRFEPGTLLIVEISDKVDKSVHAVGVRVVHATPEEDTCWIIGCEIISPLSEDKVQALA
jgi:hypothetical protein